METRLPGGGKTPAPDDMVLAEMVSRLVEVYQPERIFLFGSVARGEAGPDSDCDLMVVVPDDAPPERQRSLAGYRAVRHLGAARDIFVAKAGEFRRQLHLKASFPSTVVREGIVLYAA
jgi:uncharacterized protein